MPQDEFYGFSGPAVPNVWPAPGKINIGNNEYGDVPGAISALFSSDTLIVGAGVMAVLQQKINTNCNIQGSGIGVSRWLLSSSYAAAVQFGSIVGYVQDMTIEAQSGVVSPIAIEVSGTSAVMEFRRVFGRCINTINDIGSTAWATRGTVLLSQCEGSGKKANGTTLTALQVAAGTTTVVGGYYEGRLTVDSGATCVLFGPVITGSVNISGTATGHYYDSTGNLITINTSGESSGVWLVDESATRKLKQSTLAAAITAAASSGDSIKLDSDTYAISTQQTIDKSLTIEGDGPEATIITVNLADNAALRPNADNITVVFRNLTIDHNAGAGTLGGALFNNNAGVKVILDNAVVKKSGGAPTTGYGAWLLAGTLELRNGSKLLCTSGASQYGVLNDSSGDVTIIIGPGCEVGGATADVYSNRAGSVLQVQDCIFTNGYTDWAGDVNGQYHGAKLVTNSSGATAPGRDVGYINADGDYVTTSTANIFTGSNCVVVVSGGSTKKCFVATSGRWPVRYAGSAPSDGDFLVTSTTAGAAGAQATMRPEIFARCQAAGSGGTVLALLLCNTTYVSYLSSNNIYRCDSHASSIFVATINGSPSSTSVVYNNPSSGQENVLPPNASTELAKLMLYNSTRGTYRLITAVNTGTNTITTVASTDAWASGDTITIANATVSDPLTERFAGFDLSQQTEIPLLARAIAINEISSDSGGAGYGSQFHPYEAYSGSKIINSTITNSTGQIVGNIPMPLINQKFGKRETASGTSTKLTLLKISGYWLATP